MVRILNQKSMILIMAITAMSIGAPRNADAYYYPYKPEEKCFRDESIKHPYKSLLRALEKGYSRCPYAPLVDDSNYIKNRTILPPGAVKRYLSKEYDVANFFYTQYKIVGERPGPIIDGYETIQYQVEFLYVILDLALTGLGEVLDENNAVIKVIEPKIMVIPLCEKASAWITIGKTPWGWFKLNNIEIGDRLDSWIESHYSAIMSEINMPWGKESLNRFNKRKNYFLALAKRCKKNL